MTAESGRGFLVKIGDGGNPELFQTVAGLRATALVIDAEPVDVTNKDSGGWRALLPGAGTRRVRVSGNGVFWNSAAESTMRGHALAGTVANYELVFENGDLFTGPFLVTSLEYAGDHNGERTYAVTLESAGAIAFTPGP